MRGAPDMAGLHRRAQRAVSQMDRAVADLNVVVNAHRWDLYTVVLRSIINHTYVDDTRCACGYATDIGRGQSHPQHLAHEIAAALTEPDAP